jgi:hypothetical protein
MTVSGLTIVSAERQPRQKRDRQIHNRWSAEVSLKHTDLVTPSQILELEGGTRSEGR